MNVVFSHLKITQIADEFYDLNYFPLWFLLLFLFWYKYIHD